ncbi:MAG: hypothetical protein EBQ96_06590 [Proteobacteria bacterium]|nr:hypothetical protein [Pseudomonadota bacterium]
MQGHTQAAPDIAQKAVMPASPPAKDAIPNQPLYEVAGVKNLRIGQIISAKIPTIKDGIVHLYDRDCIILGFEGTAKKEHITGLYLARLAYARVKFDPEFGHVVDADEFRQAGIHGLRNSFVLRTDRVDLLPIDPLFLGRHVTEIGYISERETMLQLGDAILRGLMSGNGEASRGPRQRLEGSDLRQTIAPGMMPVFEKFPLARIAREMTKLKRAGTDDYERALYQLQLMKRQAAGAAERAFRREAAIKRREVAEAAAAMAAAATAGEDQAPRRVRTEYLKPSDVKRGRRRRMSDTAVERLVTRVNERVRRNREELGLDAPRDPGHIRGNAIAAATPKHQRITRSADLSSVRPLFSVADNYVPILPKGTKRGNVLVLKIADILDPKDKRPAQRPCVVWNVYEDKETGEVCGFDVFPRTRLRAHQFDEAYMAEFPNLYNNRIWDGGRIITQMFARVEVGPKHFHPFTKRVRTLNPKLVEELVEKRNACETSGKTMTPYGLAEIPENWKLREAEPQEASASEIAHAEHIHDHLERHKAALDKAPDVGDVVLRKVVRDGEVIEVPTLIWGVWRNKVTGLPAAFDCVKLDTEDKITRAWRAILPLELENGEALAADMSTIDLLYNTEKYFTPGSATVIDRLSQADMEKLRGIRGTVLIQCKDRKGAYPEFLPFDWERIAGPSYGFGIATLKSKKFAPDLSACTDPGYLRHHRGRRDDNRRGMAPRRKNEGFRPKRAPV